MYEMNDKIDGLIGNTPIMRLRKIEEKYALKAKLFAKLEYFNPGGSIKDRVAKAMIDEAEKTGALKKNGQKRLRVGFLRFGGLFESAFVLGAVDVREGTAGSGAGRVRGNIGVNINVVDDLEVVHPDAKEVGAAVERETEPLLRRNGAGGQRFERDPRLRTRFHKRFCVVRAAAVDVVVFLRVLRRPVRQRVVRLHPKVRDDSEVERRLERFDAVSAEPRRKARVANRFDDLSQAVELALANEPVASFALRIDRRRTAVDGALDDVRIVGALRNQLHFAVGPLPVVRHHLALVPVAEEGVDPAFFREHERFDALLLGVIRFN